MCSKCSSDLKRLSEKLHGSFHKCIIQAVCLHNKLIKSISSRYRHRLQKLKNHWMICITYKHSLVEQITADFQIGDPPFGPGRFPSFLRDFFSSPFFFLLSGYWYFFIPPPSKETRKKKKKWQKYVCNGMLGFTTYRERGFCASHCRNAT